MRFLSILLFSLFIVVNTSFAEAIQGEFLPSTSITKIKEGDLIEATLRFWSIENADFSQFKKLEKTMLFNSFYLAQVTSLGVSPNNADVVELKGIFVVRSTKLQPIYSFKYNNANIDLKIGSLKIEELKDPSKDFYILDQSLTASRLWMIVSGICFILLVIAIIKRDAIKKIITGLKPDALKKAKKRYDSLFRSADKREDFELLYREKDKWLSILSEKAPAHTEFLSVLNQHQFKKEWGNEEYAEVRSSFDVIRRSFEK